MFLIPIKLKPFKFSPYLILIVLFWTDPSVLAQLLRPNTNTTQIPHLATLLATSPPREGGAQSNRDMIKQTVTVTIMAPVNLSSAVTVPTNS